MRNLLKKIAVATLLICFALSTAQGVSIKQKIADFYFKELAYKKALSYYIELAESKKANEHVVRRTAECYNKIGNSQKAVKWYTVLREEYHSGTEDKYENALALRRLGRYDESLVLIKAYLAEGGTSEYAKFIVENPDYVQKYKKDNNFKYSVVGNLSFNSSLHDFGATFYGDKIVFTSPEKKNTRRLGEKFRWDETNFLKLYSVRRLGDGTYSKPKEFFVSKKDHYHDGPVAFSPDMKEMYLTRSNYGTKGKLGKSEEGIVEVNLYVAKSRGDGKWSDLKPFAYNSSEYSTGSAALSADGDIMVFASDMPGTEGQTDLWVTRRDGMGQWETPRNLGRKINSSKRDNYPFLDKDGNLYYASEGKPGLGGYDIFWVPGFLEGKDEVINMGAPINSPADDFCLIYNSDKSMGYFNSGRPGVLGSKGCDDIFSFKKLVSLVEVIVIDKETGERIPHAMGCVQTPQGDFIEKDIKTDKSGKFKLELAAKDYTICASHPGYIGNTKKIKVPKGKFLSTIIELEKEKVEIPCPKIVLEDIFYDFDKYNIRDDASTSLDDLVEFLKEYPEVRIELASHTDSRGTRAYNETLSQNRANAALGYLERRGIDRSRMTGIGYGETQLINHCADGVSCTEREHQANRRTEVTLISDGCLEVTKKTNRYLE